jgi:AraC family transcriptional regulator
MTSSFPLSRHVAAGDIVSHAESGAGISVSAVHESPGARLNRHRHQQASLMVVTSGAITIEDPLGVYLLSAGSIAIRLPGATHVHAAGPLGARYVLVEFSSAALDHLGAARVAFEKARTFGGRSSVDLAVRLTAELHRADEFMPFAVRIFVQGIALGCARYTRYGKTREAPLAAAARRRIERDQSSALNVHLLATSLGCTAAHLSRVFRATYGLSPLEYSLRRRIERGRRLLAGSARSITDIALTLGFHDSSHFARHFRRINGIGAREFRTLGALSASGAAQVPAAGSKSYR